jgi:hypothetical protein
MGFGKRLHTLWRLKAGVIASIMLALLVSVWSVYKISLSPFGLSARSWDMATASSHVVIDTPTSALLDLRQDTYSLQSLTNRGVLLGNVMASAPVRQAIAARAHVPIERLEIDAPLTPQQPRPAPEEGKEPKTSDIAQSTDEYRLNIQAAPTVPLLDFIAQAPTAESAAALANAASAELKAYLTRLAASQQTPASEQIRVVELGRAKGTVINASIHWQVPLVAFLLTLGASCATLIFLQRVRLGWKDAARSERTVDPLEAQPLHGR